MDGLPGIQQIDVALFMTQHAGDTISVISELSAAAEMRQIVDKETFAEALGAILDELVKVSGYYGDYLNALLLAIVTSDLGLSPLSEIIGNEGALALADAKLRFFVVPPGAPTEP